MAEGLLNVEGLLGIVDSQNLRGDEKLDIIQFNSEGYKGEKVMVFDNEENAQQFRHCFVFDYLVPKYGIEEVDNFLKIEKGTFLIIPKERFPDFQHYINSLNNYCMELDFFK